MSQFDNVNVKQTSGTQIPVKRIVKKYRNLARKPPYQRPLPTIIDDLADLETVDYNIDTNINYLNDIVDGPKKIKMLRLLLTKFYKNTKKCLRKRLLFLLI